MFMDLIPFGLSYFHSKYEWTLYIYLLFWCITLVGDR